MSIQALSQFLKKSQQKGFTLVELLTTVAIIGISLGIGVPNLQNMMQDNHQVNAMNEFGSYVSFARNEAVVRNTTVKLCIANENQNGCAEDDSNWANGYLVIAGNEVLKIHDKLPGNQIIEGSFEELTFLSNGLLSSSGTMNFCDGRENTQPRSVTINMGSQIRQVTSTGSCTG